jgi:hypothetical protein
MDRGEHAARLVNAGEARGRGINQVCLFDGATRGRSPARTTAGRMTSPALRTGVPDESRDLPRYKLEAAMPKVERSGVPHAPFDAMLALYVSAMTKMASEPK